MTRKQAATAIASVGLAVALTVPASAVVTGFASYSSPNGRNNVQYVSSGTGATRANNGIYQTVSSTVSRGKVTYKPGPVLVQFSFFYPEFSGVVTNISALYSLSATVTKDTAPSSSTGAFTYGNVNGTFSFVTTAPITVGGPNFVPHTYAAGSILLAGKIVGGVINGTFKSTSGGSFSSGAQSVFQYRSDFLDFTNVDNVDRSQSLTSVTLPFTLRSSLAKYGLGSFTALAGGTFSADPVPLVNGLAIVPEPATWAMLIVGFGLIGIKSRRHARAAAVSA